MKTNSTIAAIAAVGLATFGIATSAYAGKYHFEPLNSTFTAKGDITVSAGAVSLPCTATLQGTTTGGGEITSATFRGISCAALTASNLPWKLTTFSATGATFHGVVVSALILGVCGPGDLKATLPGGNRIVISGSNLPGLVPCSVSGTLITKPALKIVHN